jgi:hypothetical protein
MQLRLDQAVPSATSNGLFWPQTLTQDICMSEY